MKENNEIEAVVSNIDKNGTKTFEAKKEKTYNRKDLITTAIIAFLIGAIITAGGFAISKAIKGGRGDREFRPNGIQRNINQGDFDINPDQNGKHGKMYRRGNIQNNNQNPPSMPNNEQQPNNSNATPSTPSAPTDNNQNSASNKS